MYDFRNTIACIALIGCTIGLVGYSPVCASAPELSPCPSQFHSITLHTNAKLCQIFDSSTPASMIYHVNNTPRDVVAFFLADRRLVKNASLHNRVLLMSADKSYRVIVSPDGAGSQVDILITTPSV